MSTKQQNTGGKKDHQDQTEYLNTYARNAYNEDDEHAYETCNKGQSNTNNEEAKSLDSFQYDNVANLKQDMEKNKKLNLNIEDDNGYIGFKMTSNFSLPSYQNNCKNIIL
jgi:hypothetical protein